MLAYTTLWFVINHNHISQSSAATYLRCVGIFKHKFVANLQPSPSAQQMSKNSVNIFGSYAQESVSYFLTHSVEGTA